MIPRAEYAGYRAEDVSVFSYQSSAFRGHPEDTELIDGNGCLRRGNVFHEFMFMYEDAFFQLELIKYKTTSLIDLLEIQEIHIRRP